jgi:hypothetical protein
MDGVLVYRVRGLGPWTPYLLAVLVVEVTAANHGEAHFAGTNGWVDNGAFVGPDIALAGMNQNFEIEDRRTELSSSRLDGCIPWGRWVYDKFGGTRTQKGRSALRPHLLQHLESWLELPKQGRSRRSQQHLHLQGLLQDPTGSHLSRRRS